jgi:hypothetical protein
MSDALSEAATAGVASAMAKVSTYPFDLLKARMATSDSNQGVFDSLGLIIQQDGVLGLYKGSGPRVTKSVTGKVLYFYLYRTLTNLVLQADKTRCLTAFENVVVGYLSDIFGLPLVMPLDAIATRIQLTKTPTTFVQVAQDLYNEKRLFVSWEAYVLGAMQPALQNTIFDQIKAQVYKGRALSALESFILGVVAASVSMTATYPLDFARTVSQNVSKKTVKRKLTLVVCHTASGECVKLAEKHDLIHLSPTSLKKSLLDSSCSLGDKARSEFTRLGSLSDSIVVDFVFQLIANDEYVSNKRGFLLEGFPAGLLQSETSNLGSKHERIVLIEPGKMGNQMVLLDQDISPEKPSTSVAEILRTTIEREGLKGVFKGLSANLIQGVLSAALMLMIKEKLARIIAALIRKLKHLLGFA